MARVKFQHDWDWDGAEADYRQALQLNPGYAPAHQAYGQHLAAVGRFDEAFAQLKRAEELDPVSVDVQASLGRVSNYPYRHLYTGLAYMFQSKFSKAVGEFQTMFKVEGEHHPWALAYLGYTYALWGKRAEAEAMVHELTELSKNVHLLFASLPYLRSACLRSSCGRAMV